MCDTARQLANGFHFLSHRQLFARLDQFLLCVAPLGCVPEYVGKTEQISMIIANRRHRASDKKGRAVLFDAPSFNFVLASLDGIFQSPVRIARATLIRPIKYSEMLADNFFRGISHDFLCATVPTCNAACRVEYENGIVHDTFDQNLEMTLGAVERQVCLLNLAVQLILRR